MLLAVSVLPLFRIMTVLLVALWLIILDVADVTYDGKRHSPVERFPEVSNFGRFVSKMKTRRGEKLR
jgi:hypothetical protein